ncbi:MULTISPECIES: flagellin lysine-N-methylase [unclassified Corallococcus]|uniref:flagellin lysine-N-methylase n=1 Tax=unclassified Corallococcus TaxID=2685029 RepID=UPI001A8CD1C2|nr:MULTISPECIES: flagellin lysine-N-methylase [unclassified Corallococcus]MBN9682322.1 flagellin lysine-N-methylase [Corallococcus sp. NCSPR001]WAS86122.1 flagellin lysine-N-methylase [Corallococcus sp. NCRR]
MTASAPRYMARFRCIAEACEDTCCAGLTVPISESRWSLLRQKVAGTPDEARVAALITPNPDGATGQQAGILGKRADGHCAFLDEAKLCSLQRRYGEAVLPDGCSVFPRVLTRWGAQVEMAGSLACPETARLCLLAEDALVREPVPEEQALRPQVARQVAAGDDAWTAHADTVREAMLRLLNRREVPYAARLYALGRMALDLGDFYLPGTTAFGSAAGEATRHPSASDASAIEVREPMSDSAPEAGEGRAEAAEARLTQVLREYESADMLASLHAQLQVLELPGGPWAGICGAVLRSREAAVSSPRFLALMDAVRASYGGADTHPDPAWELHAARRSALEALHGERVHQYFLHHALNHVLRHPFTEAESLLNAVFLLVLRASVVRWVLLGHPAVVALLEAPGTPVASLDAAAVEAFQVVAKHVEQAPSFLDFAKGLAGEGPETFARLLILVKGL